jgi:DDE superfamily endonuclease
MDRERVYSSPACQREQEDCLMFRIIRVPAALDNFFQPVERHFHWNYFMYFRVLVVAMAFMWGRRNVATLYRYLDAAPHRTRFNNFFLVERWDPEAVLRQKAQALLRVLRPGKGETIYLIVDDSKKAKRGKAMDAIAKMKDPTTEAYIRGHQYVCAILVCRGYVIPFGIRLYVKKAHCAALGLTFRKTTELAAQLIREFKPPAGVKVVVLFDTYYLCPTVVKACREPRFHFASTLKSHRSLFKHGWKLKAGRYGRNLCRRRRTDTLDLAKPYGPVRYRFVDAGWLEVSRLGPLHVVFSRKGTTRKLLGLVADDPQLSAADLIRTYEKRWTIGASSQGRCVPAGESPAEGTGQPLVA